MKESQIRQLFLIIINTYSNFVYDDYKVELWREILDDVPYEMAQKNLWAYIRDPENKFPPHPGALAETRVQRSEGPYIPNAAETRQMLDERDRQLSLAVPMPAQLREELKHLAERKRSE